jgi:N-acetyl-anhydromuramoyl-L-alanine amidase
MHNPLPPASETSGFSGWLAGVQHIPSPNVGPRPTGISIDLVVVHSISLPPGQYGGPQIEQLFTNQLDFDAHPYFQHIRGLEVSSHLVVRRNGHVQQFASTWARAWHAGTSQWRGRSNCNDFSIGIELEGLEGEVFEPVQYAQLAHLCTQLRIHHPLRSIVGHEHIAPGRKFDPGAGFDWPYFKSLVIDSAGWDFP